MTRGVLLLPLLRIFGGDPVPYSTSIIKYEVTEKVLNAQNSATLYDNVLVKFDSECSADGDVSLEEYILGSLERVASSAKTGRSFTAEMNAKSAVSLPTSKEFGSLLKSDLFSRVHDAVRNRDSQGRMRMLQAVEGQKVTDVQVTGRKLRDLDEKERENSILSTLHLLATATLVGTEKVVDVLKLEGRGELLRHYVRANRVDQPLRNATAYETTDAIESMEEGERSSEEIEKELMSVLNGESLPPPPDSNFDTVASYETLDFVKVCIIRNPFLAEKMGLLAGLLPCLKLEPEPDLSKQSLSEWDVVNTLNEQPQQLRSAVEVYPVDPASATKYLMSDVDRTPQSAAHGPSYTFIPPNDPHFDSQWYLKGPTQGEKYGAQVVDGWASLIKELGHSNSTSLEFESLLKHTPGMNVAVLDSGCSRNPDLVHQFWRNPNTPGCTGESFVGTASNSIPKRVSGDCVGYDFGNDSPDPTQEVSGRIHGSSTAGLIAAEANNAVGIAGICPTCNVVCLKIYDSTHKRITMTSVVRALDYMGRHDIKLSNHSYGGFGSSQIERAAHEALSKLGHLAICSAGNNACNIDSDAAGTDPRACLADDGATSLGPFTPATYDVPGILSVGGTNQKGELAWFSNYGRTSVDIFAPGDAIVTLYGSDQLASVKGTSFSSPIVSGIAAVLWSNNPHLTGQQVKQRLIATGIDIPALHNKGKQPRIVSLAQALSPGLPSLSGGSNHVLTLQSGAPSMLAFSALGLLVLFS